MFFTAAHSEFLHDHKDYGFTVSDYKFDWRWADIAMSVSSAYSILTSVVKKSRDEYIKRLNGIYFSNLDKVNKLQ